LFALTIREHLILLSIMVIGLVITLRWTLRPMIQFGETLLQRQPGSLERLDDKNAPAELTPIIFAMNDYVARLDKTLGAYEQFVANTAHHLRTTFAILTSQINFGLRDSSKDQSAPEILAAMRRTVAEGSKVINQLLMLASVEQERAGGVGVAEVNLAAIVKDVMEELAPLAQQRHIELGIECIDEDIYLRAPPHLLREVLANLLDNSMQHMKRPGSVTVLLSRQAQFVLLRISDSGPGIPAEERLKVFERFYRLDKSKTGSSGLGLAIVKEICDALHAQITLGLPACGTGLQVDIVFPRSI
jgi:two-component system, OmpR family, sensor histidine kinase TctE